LWISIADIERTPARSEPLLAYKRDTMGLTLQLVYNLLKHVRLPEGAGNPRPSRIQGIPGSSIEISRAAAPFAVRWRRGGGETAMETTGMAADAAERAHDQDERQTHGRCWEIPKNRATKFGRPWR